MNGNSQYNYRGGWWKNMPSADFSQGEIPHGSGLRAFADNRHIPYPTPPTYYADNRHIPHQTRPAYYADNRHIPHQTRPAYYADNRHIPHQMLPAYYADNQHIPHQMPTCYADNWHIPHQAPAHYVDNRNLPHQTLTHHVDNRHLSHQTPADNRHLPHPTPAHYADKGILPLPTPAHYADKRHLPHPTPAYCTDNKHLPHQTAEHYEDKMCLPHQTANDSTDKTHLPNQNPEDCAADKCLPHKTPDLNADKRQLPQQTSEACADKRQLPHQTPEHYVDKNLSQQTPRDCADKKCLPQQTPKDCADKKCLPQETPEDCADKKCLPQQTPKDCADKKCLPQETPEDCADKKCLPQQTPEDCADKKCLPQQTPEDCANKKCLPPLLHCEVCDLKMNPKCMESHIKGKKHRRRLLELCEQSAKHKASSGKEIRHNQSSQTSKEAYVDNKGLPHRLPKHNAAKNNLTQQTPEVYADKKCLPQQTPKDFANKRPLSHKKARKFRRRLLKLEKSMKLNTSHGEEIRHIQSSQINPVVQPKKVPADVSKRNHGDHTGAKDCDFKVENVKNGTSSSKKTKVPAEMSKRKVMDNTDAKDHGFEHEIEGATGGKYMKMNDGIRRFVKSSKTTPVLAEKSSFELQSQHVPALLSQESKGKKHHKFQNTTVEKNDQPQPTPVELNASTSSNIIAETEYISCDFAATVTPQGPVASQYLLREVTEAKEHHEVQKCGVETNDKPQSVPTELQALGCCNISTTAEDKFSDSGAIVIALPQGLMTSHVLTPSPAAGSSFEPPIQIKSQMEVEGTELHGVQNHSVETNDQPHSISMEFHATAGSDINTLIEGTCSDTGAILIAPPQSPIAFEVSTPVAVIQTEMSDNKVHNEIPNHIVDSNYQQRSISMELHDSAGSMTNNQAEVVNSDSTATETEPHVSEAILNIESQHPAEETDIELLPPVLMEIDVALEVGAETKTEDKSFQAEMKMDVDLSPESGKTKLLKVSVCLTCGDEGFEEAIVCCSKCGDYAMHRYCLAGPVVYTDEVTWFCMDCEEMVVEADHPNGETPESEKDEVLFDPQPIADPIWRGSLQVFNKSFDKIGGLMGHLSTLACPKVLEETRNLPDVLYANLLQRSAVWPESFKKFGTNNQSIGLYFFPDNERVERYFDQLVDDMISKDLAIRVMVEKTDLLIFPSTLLPRQYKRFQSKCYLWGIFKRKQASSTIKDT